MYRRVARRLGQRTPRGTYLVSSANREHVRSHALGDSKSVVLLQVLPLPDIRALDRHENSRLMLHDGLHGNVVENSANETAQDLYRERASWREMCGLSEFEVLQQKKAQTERIVHEYRKVHVCCAAVGIIAGEGCMDGTGKIEEEEDVWHTS